MCTQASSNPPGGSARLEIVSVRDDKGYPFEDVLIQIRNSGSGDSGSYQLTYDLQDRLGYIDQGTVTGPRVPAGSTVTFRLKTGYGCNEGTAVTIIVPGQTWKGTCG